METPDGNRVWARVAGQMYRMTETEDRTGRSYNITIETDTKISALASTKIIDEGRHRNLAL